MKFALVFLAILAVCAGHAMYPKEKFGMKKLADKDFLMKQKFIFDALYNIHMPMTEEYMKDLSGFVEGKEYYNDYEKVMKFFMMYRYGLMPRNYVFSVFNFRHVTELKGLFNLFYYSRDWATFYRNVLWARHNVNEGMFVYALYAAVIHRKDMQGIILPAHYEVLPYMYFNGLTIDEILKYKTLGFSKMDSNVLILGKYTDEIEMMNDESKLAYFTEDIGWNMYYYFFNLDYPYWMGGKDFDLYKDRRGEQFLYMHQQLLARYFLERMSNSLGDIPEFSWYGKIKTGYNPQMRYYNGLPFTVRKNYYEIYNTGEYNTLNRIDDFERRIRDVIDLGYFETATGGKIDLWTKDGIDMLGNLIQSNPDSMNEKFFGKLIVYAFKMLSGGKFYEMYDYKVSPGVLDNFETMLRDPLFYQFYKKIVKFWFMYKNNLPSYKYDELLLPGVKINKVDVSKLVTYFDYFDIDVSTMIESDSLMMMKGLPKKYMGMDYMNKEMMGKDYFYNKDYMSKDYMSKGYMNKDYISKDYMSKDYMNKDYMNKDYLYSKEMMDKDYFYNKDMMNKDYYYKKDMMNKDYFYTKDMMDKEYMPYNKDYYMKSNFDKDMYDKDYFMKKDYMMMDKDMPMDTKYMGMSSMDMKDYDTSKWNYKYMVRQWRLNHKPFTMSIDVTADKPQSVVFRVYMGPKFDSTGKLISINENRENFVEIDQFVYELKSGLNTIRRESREFYYSIKDRTMYSDLYKMVMMGLEGKMDFPLDMSEAHCGFPDRLLLPKGWVSGMPMQFFFMITPLKDTKQFSNYKYWFSCGVGSGTRFIDDLPFGYPFDRFIDESYFFTPNMYMKDAFIYHLDDMHKLSEMTLNKMDSLNFKDLMYSYKDMMVNKMDDYKDVMMGKMDTSMDYKKPWMMEEMDSSMEYKKPWIMNDMDTSMEYKKPWMMGKMDSSMEYKYPSMMDKMDSSMEYKYPWMKNKMDMSMEYKKPWKMYKKKMNKMRDMYLSN